MSQYKPGDIVVANVVAAGIAGIGAQDNAGFAVVRLGDYSEFDSWSWSNCSIVDSPDHYYRRSVWYFMDRHIDDFLTAVYQSKYGRR